MKVRSERGREALYIVQAFLLWRVVMRVVMRIDTLEIHFKINQFLFQGLVNSAPNYNRYFM